VTKSGTRLPDWLPEKLGALIWDAYRGVAIVGFGWTCTVNNTQKACNAPFQNENSNIKPDPSLNPSVLLASTRPLSTPLILDRRCPSPGSSKQSRIKSHVDRIAITQGPLTELGPFPPKSRNSEDLKPQNIIGLCDQTSTWQPFNRRRSKEKSGSYRTVSSQRYTFLYFHNFFFLNFCHFRRPYAQWLVPIG